MDQQCRDHRLHRPGAAAGPEEQQLKAGAGAGAGAEAGAAPGARTALSAPQHQAGQL